MRQILKQPLVHFCLIGGLFYLAVYVFAPASDDVQTIHVTRAALMQFIQQRTQIYDPDFAAARLDAMSAEEKALLKRDYIEEEALYRAAQQLGLETQDYVIRRRIVQKMDYAARSSSPIKNPSDAELRSYFAQHKDRYESPAKLSFTHVYFSQRGDADAAAAAAAAAAAQLGAGSAPPKGERFVYGLRFINSAAPQLADIFGADFVTQLRTLEAKQGKWHGPIASKTGYHLVQLLKIDTPIAPRFDDIRPELERDLRYDLEEAARREAIEEIVQSYSVRDDT